MDLFNRLGFGACDPRIRNQTKTTGDGLATSDDVMPDADDEPDEKPPTANLCTSREFKKMPCGMARKQSLLTQTLHTSESDSHHDDEYSEALFSGSNRAHSTTSTWSRGSEVGQTSDADASSVKSATSSPMMHPLGSTAAPPLFNHKPFETRASNKTTSDSVDPLRVMTPLSQNEDAVEKGLGRKRCIMFACKATAEQSDEKKEDSAKAKIEPPKPEAAPQKGPLRARLPSPAPARASPRSPKITRAHRGSDSTVRNESPKSVRKVPSITRTRPSSSGASGVPVCEATRFHEFASSEEECEDWTVEKSCYRTRLTVQDTLKVENNLRQLGEEAEDEELEEEEAEEQMAILEDDDDDVDEDEDEDDDNQSLVDSTGYVTDEGFHTDDEEGFAASDDDSDAGSDYEWWAPGTRSSGVPEHIRPLAPHRASPSSIGSFSSTRVFPSKTTRVLKRNKTNAIDFRPRTPDLPDSTDFVCGTLDEDKPIEDAWRTCREQRRAAKHKVRAQDIDPTFPASDPEMDEEDENDEFDGIHMDIDDSDHPFLIHGHPAGMSEDEEDRIPRRLIPKKRSPAHSPKRLRSPPPAAKLRLHSPPPRRLFAGRSPTRAHSPAPRRPVRSPPPSRRTSFLEDPNDGIATPVALAQRPHYDRTASSVPRNGPFPTRANYFQDSDSDKVDDEDTQREMLPTRGAIDIVKGLEKKRQRRREKMFEKHCRQRAKSKKHVHDDVVLPGIGAQKMRQMGEGLCKLRGHGIRQSERGAQFEAGAIGDGQHILSY